MWAVELDDEACTDLTDADLSQAITRLQAVAAVPLGTPALLTTELAALAPAPRQQEGESAAAYQARLAEAAAKYKAYLGAKKKSREVLKEAAEAASLLENAKALHLELCNES